MKRRRTKQRTVLALYSLGYAVAIFVGWYVWNHPTYWLQSSTVTDQQTQGDTTLKKSSTINSQPPPRYLIGFEWIEWKRTDERVTIYTYTSDKGGRNRTTAALNFREGGLRQSTVGQYPKAATKLNAAHLSNIRFVAIPWDWRVVHETIESWGKGQAWHSFAVMFPDRDPDQFYWPIDRVPKWRKTNKGYKVRQTAFDIFADMPDVEARAIGDPVETVVIYKRTPVYSDEPGARDRLENGWIKQKKKDTP